MHQTNFQAPTLPGIALGCNEHTNGMIFWSPETQRFSVSADYKLDTEKQVRTHWPDLLNDGGFTIHYVGHPADADSTARFSVGDMVVFAPEHPPNAVLFQPVMEWWCLCPLLDSKPIKSGTAGRHPLGLAPQQSP